MRRFQPLSQIWRKNKDKINKNLIFCSNIFTILITLINRVVNESISLVVILILASAFITFIIGLFIFQMYKKNRYTPQIFLAMAFSLVAIVLATFDMLFQNTELYNIDLFFLKSIFVSISYFFIYTHYEAILGGKNTRLRYSIVYSLTIVSVILYLLKLFNIIPPFITRPLIPFDSIEAILGIIIFSFSIHVLNKTYRNRKSRNVLLELFAQVLLLVANVSWLLAELIWSVYGLTEVRLYTIMILTGSGLIFIGITLIMVNYYINLEYLYHVPILMHSILIINFGGTPIYHRKMVIQEKSLDINFNEMLFSGALFALHSLMKEVFNESTNFESINLGGYKIVFADIKGEYILVLLTSGTNYFMKRSFEKLRDSICDVSLPKNLPINPHDFSKIIDPLIIRNFPYLQFENPI